MGLDIGIISVQYLDRPSGYTYEFMKEMAIEASADGYMTGAGNNWGLFYKLQLARMLLRFAAQEGLTRDETREVWRWVQSLPWDEDFIELHFNW